MAWRCFEPASKVSPIVVDRDDVEITYGSFDVRPPEHCNYYFRVGSWRVDGWAVFFPSENFKIYDFFQHVL